MSSPLRRFLCPGWTTAEGEHVPCGVLVETVTNATKRCKKCAAHQAAEDRRAYSIRIGRVYSSKSSARERHGESSRIDRPFVPIAATEAQRRNAVTAHNLDLQRLQAQHAGRRAFARQRAFEEAKL